jgi:hypothetical protein
MNVCGACLASLSLEAFSSSQRRKREAGRCKQCISVNQALAKQDVNEVLAKQDLDKRFAKDWLVCTPNIYRETWDSLGFKIAVIPTADIRVRDLGGSSTDIHDISKTATIGEVKYEYARQQGAVSFSLATRERVLGESELISDIILDSAEKSDTLELVVLFNEGQKCDFASAFDQNGVLFFIGTNGNAEAYKNPHSSGEVNATMSMWEGEHAEQWRSSEGCAAGSGPAQLVQHEHVGGICTLNISKDQEVAWVAIDLGEGRSLVPNCYCVRHGYSSPHFLLRSWNFEGSHNGRGWKIMKAHKNDSLLRNTKQPQQGFSVAAWEVKGVEKAYRHFRIRMTGKHWSDGHVLCCGGIELYGQLFVR